MSQFQRKDPPWSHVGVPSASAGLSQMMTGSQSLLGAQPGVVGTPTTNVYGQSATAAYPQQTLQQRQQTLTMQQAAATQNAAIAAAAAAAGSGSGSQQPQLTVSYPTTRATQGAQQPRQRVFTGTVTKLHDTFGFVDEDVFFQTNTVKGSMPKIGDRVLVEATYNSSMPFKWNATRVQMLNSPMEQQMAQAAQQQHISAIKIQQIKQQQTQQQQPLLKAPQAQSRLMAQPAPPGLLGNPPPLLQGPGQQMIQAMQGGYNQSRAGQMAQQQSMGRRDFGQTGRSDRDRERDREQRERDRAQRERERERDREQREREREQREKERRERRDRERSERTEREKSPSRKRSRSPRRSKSPRRSPRRTKRIVPRYVVQIPRFALDIPKSDVIELHKRYGNMYIPSDFYIANFVWQEVFPIHRPMNIAQPCSFHIMHKEAPAPQGAATVIDPPDANYAYCAKVMLMGSVDLEELYEKCCARAQDPADLRDNFQHPTRMINFLVGQKGKNEVMAIGGPWSPSLDGADPVNNSSVLIKTAIRTTKALTGIDLSSCTQWYRFIELSYHRPEENHKGRVIPARIETVVIFVPDVWHVLPTKVEWENVAELYKKVLKRKLASLEDRNKKEEEATDTQEEQTGEEEAEDAEMEQAMKSPTKWSDLDPKTMKVNELRLELELRGLNSKGLKSQLIARLTKTIKTEQELEEAGEEAMEAEAAQEEAKEKAKEKEEKKEEDEEQEKKDKEENEKKEEEEKKKKEQAEEERKRQREREKKDLETRYQMPDNPVVMVHPSPIAKSGKFDCTVQSLSVLLDYRVDDNKEHSFEVFLFAELFNEMLQRDFAFNMFKALSRAPKKEEEKKEEKKDEKKKDKDKEKDKKDDEKKDEKEEPKSKRRKTSEEDREEGKDKDDDKKEDDGKEDEKDGDDESETKDDDDDDDDKKKDKKKDDRKSRAKVETLDPQLLLSCIYFDQNHAGYILERDLEEILYTIGIHLSRAQVRKLLQKVISRDCWNYRKMTDGVKKEKAEEGMVNGQLTDEELGKGNQLILEQMSISKKVGKSSGEPEGSKLVKYGGRVIDVSNLLRQVERADEERSAAQKKIDVLEKDIDELRSKADSSEKTVGQVSAELASVLKRLALSEGTLAGSTNLGKRLIDVIGSAQKNLDEIMLKFNEVLEEVMNPPNPEIKAEEKPSGSGDAKVKGEPKVEVKAEPGKESQSKVKKEAAPQVKEEK